MYTGITLLGSDNNTLNSNIASNNYLYGIRFDDSHSNIVFGNTSSNHYYGILFSSSTNNKIYNNNFINNTIQAYYDFHSGNFFNLDAPIGGNYWSNFDTPEEGCNDLNSDGFCDLPYYFFTGGVDYLPWTKQDGWITPESLIKNIISNIGGMLNSGAINNAGIATSLTSTLENALNALEQGNKQTSENMLQAFINKIEAQAGKNITEESAARLIEAARQIIEKM